MSVATTIAIRDNASLALHEAAESVAPKRMAAAIGPAVARLVQRHLRGRGTNKRGWPTTNFWARAAKATSWAETPQGVVVSVNQIGVRQRYFGGVIKPVNKRALTIPISPVSYGKVASDFPGLFLLPTKKGAYLVQYAGSVPDGRTKKAKGAARRSMGGNAKARKDATLNFLFKLVSQVDQKPDPNVLPSKEAVLEVARGAVMGLVKPRN